MTGFGFGKGPPLTDEQRAVHDIRADETMALHARIAELEAALKPFAEKAGAVEAIYDAGVAIDDNLAVVKISSLRAARAAYLGEKND